MRLRKINGVLSLIITALLLDHAIFQAVRMLAAGQIVTGRSPMPFALLILMLVHGVICILFGILGHKGAEKRKVNSYGKLNRGALAQRVTGMLLIPLAVLHAAGAAGLTHPPKAVHILLPPVFFTVALAHAAISANKALITLGIGSAKVIKAVGIAIKVLCILTLAADLVGFYLYQV